MAHYKPLVNSHTFLVNTPTPLLLWYVVRIEKDNLPTRIPEGSVGRTLQTRNTQLAIFPSLQNAQDHYQTIAVYGKKSHGQGTNCMWSLNNVKATHLLRSRPTLTKIKIDSFVARLAKEWKSLSAFVIFYTWFQAVKNIVTNVMLYVCNNLYIFHTSRQFSLDPARIYENYERA